MRELSVVECDSVDGGLSTEGKVGFAVGVATMLFGVATVNPVLIVGGAVSAGLSIHQG